MNLARKISLLCFVCALTFFAGAQSSATNWVTANWVTTWGTSQQIP
jgi:hypothetical protein